MNPLRATKHSFRCTALLLLALTTCIPLIGQAQTYDRSAWTNYTNVNEVEGLASSGDTLWLATTGGLVRVVVSAESNPTRLTNADGLGDNDLRFVALDANGSVWTGGLNGRLCRRYADDSWRNYRFELNGSDLPLTDAAAGPNGFLWVASSIGLHKFDPERNGGEIKETYTRIGTWPASSEVSNVLLTPEYVWVVGPAGIGRAQVDDPFLLDPTQWETWSGFPALSAVEEFNGAVYVGGDGGLWSSGTLTGGDDPQWDLVGFQDQQITALTVSGDTLWVATTVGLGFCTTTDCQSAPALGTPRVSLTSVAITADGSVWSGRPPDGVRRFRNGISLLMSFDGPLSNDIVDVAVGLDGKAWCVHPFEGWDFLEDDVWTPLTYAASAASSGSPATSVAVGPDGVVWLAGWGGGAFRVNPDNPLNDWAHYDTTNTSLMWVSDPVGPNDYVVIRDVAIDVSGRVWFANAYADSGRVIAFYDHGCWGHFDRSDGFTSDDMQVLLAAPQDLLIGFSNIGLADLDYRLPLCNGSVPSEFVDGLTIKTTIDGLPANNVTAILIDRADSLWVGTNVGLVHWAADIRRFLAVPLPSEAGLAINALAADAMNTIWVGTDRGLVRLSSNGDAEFFDSDNSPLAGNSVREIAIDDRTGAVFIATNSGLTRLSAGITPADKIEDVIAMPNPFEIESGGDQHVRFNAPFGSRIYVYTVSGQFIISVDGADGWDGRNENGALVASGIYLFVVRGPDGDYGRGKIAVIQRR